MISTIKYKYKCLALESNDNVDDDDDDDDDDGDGACCTVCICLTVDWKVQHSVGSISNSWTSFKGCKFHIPVPRVPIEVKVKGLEFYYTCNVKRKLYHYMETSYFCLCRIPWIKWIRDIWLAVTGHMMIDQIRHSLVYSKFAAGKVYVFWTCFTF